MGDETRPARIPRSVVDKQASPHLAFRVALRKLRARLRCVLENIAARAAELLAERAARHAVRALARRLPDKEAFRYVLRVDNLAHLGAQTKARNLQNSMRYGMKMMQVASERHR